MKNKCFATLAAILSFAAAQPASAAASRWEEVEGGAVRVVLSASPREDGRLRGVLQVELDPGWKTYWLDPGDAGVPPSVAVSLHGQAGEVEIGYPPPGRHDDGYAVWAGYDQPVSLALTIAPPTQVDGPLEFSVFLGVCETICIPVQASFSVEPDRNMANPDHEAIVERAFAALPGEPRPGLRVAAARLDGSVVVVEAEAPAGAEAELFLASTENLIFGTPERKPRGNLIAFRVPVLSSSMSKAEEARYTLISGSEAVSGRITVVP